MRTVLVVDDDKDLRKKFKKFLRSEGFKVKTAASAIDVADNLMRERIDVILLDINIPEVDGKDIFDIIAEYPTSAQIIVSSVYPVREQKFKIKQAADYYNKAHDLDVLLKKIHKVLGL